MITNDLFIETGKICINKHSELLCGDYYTAFKERDKTVFVLSDGLGSGVKANILATLTATILGTMISKNLPLDECVNAVASTLPTCKVRNLAYATFTVLGLDNNHAYLIQYDNPKAIVLRNGKNLNYATSVRFIGEKEIHESRIDLQENDIILLMTDGVTHSGIGKLAPDGWEREDIIPFLERIYTPELSAPCMAVSICNACMTLNQNSADDDITAFVVKMKPRQSVNIMIGPPQKKEEDTKILKLFFTKDGKRVVCGGTTASTVSHYLGTPIMPVPDSGSEEVPAMATIDGVDLVTEGVITLKIVVDLCNQFIHDPFVLMDLKKRQDGAALLACLLIEDATDISIYFGTTVNLAHSDTEIDFNTKLTLIKELEAYLEQMGKRVNLSLC